MKSIVLLSGMTNLDCGTPSSYGIEWEHFRSLYFIVEETLSDGLREYRVTNRRSTLHDGDFTYYVLPDQIKFMENY
jgi:hypothetical protein